MSKVVAIMSMSLDGRRLLHALEATANHVRNDRGVALPESVKLTRSQ